MSLLDLPFSHEFVRNAPEPYRFVQKHKYDAKRFIFDDAVTTKIATLIKDDPYLITQNFQFALPPYPVTYLEFNINLFLSIIGRRVIDEMSGVIDEMSDYQVGYLIIDNTALVLSNTRHHLNPGISLVSYTFGGKPIPHTVPLEIDGMTELATFLGSTLSHKNSGITEEVANYLHSNFRAWRYDSPILKNRTPFLCQTVAGELRNLLTLLLWVNQPRIIYTESVKASQGMFRNKPIAYAAHHVVKLREGVTAKKVKTLFTDRAGPRRHEVRSFWRHIKCAPNCIHQWPIFPDENDHFICDKCKGIRVRVKSHMRGDANRGYVTKDYKV